MRCAGVIKPPITVSSVRWRLIGVVLWIGLAWFGSNLIRMATNSPPVPLTLEHLLIGGLWGYVDLYAIWAWRKRRRYARWHRWLATLLRSIYITGLMMLGAWKLFGVLAPWPWSRILQTTLATGYIVALLLPAISFSLADILHTKQMDLDLFLLNKGGLGCLGALSVVGALIGLYGGEKRVFWITVIAIFLAVSAIGWVQYFAPLFWQCRPWAHEKTKEDEGGY